jgi:DNA-binding IscR family transcriptional regulator
LLGAEITRSLVSFYWEEDKTMPSLPSNALIRAFRLIGHLWQAQRHGELMTLSDLLHLEPYLSDLHIEILLNHLEKARWIHRTETRHYALSRDIHEVTLLDLYQAMSGMLLEPVTNDEKVWNQALGEVLCQTRTMLDEILRVPLTQFYEKDSQINREQRQNDQ